MLKETRKPILSTSRLVFFGLSLVLFYFAAKQISQLNQVKNLLLGMAPGWLLLALGTQVMTYVCNAWIVKALLKGKTGTAGFLALFKISVVIMFVNQLLPTGGISGNGYIFNELIKRNIQPSKAFRALILETLCYYVAFLFLLGSAFGWYADYAVGIKSQITYTVFAGFIFFGVLGVIIVLVSHKCTLTWLSQKLSRFTWIQRYTDKLNVQLLHNNQGSNVLRGNEKPAVIGVMLQIGILLLDTLTVFALVKGLGANMPYELIIFGFLLTLVIGSLPTLPGSLVAYEGAMIYFFHLFGLPIQTALVLTLLFRFFTFWLPIPVGLLLYRNLQRTM